MHVLMLKCTFWANANIQHEKILSKLQSLQGSKVFKGTVVLRKMQRFSDFATFRLIKRRHKFKKCSCICSWCDFCKINDECSLWQHWIQTSKQKQKPSRQPRQSCPHFQPIFCKIWNANFLKKFTYFQGFLLTFNVMTDIFWWFRTHISAISNCC